MTTITMVMVLLMLSSSHSKERINETDLHHPVINNSLVMDIVKITQDRKEYKNYVFYVSQHLMEDSEMTTTFFKEFFDSFPTVATILIVSNNRSMDGFLTTSTLCLILTTARNDPIMELAALSLKSVRFLKTIFIWYPLTDEQIVYDNFNNHIRSIFAWVWRKQFLNTLLITIHNNVYIYEPYPRPNVVNITAKWTAKDIFQKYQLDFKGYLLHTEIHYDLPRVFRKAGPSLGRRRPHRLSGISGKLFLDFVKAINATFNYTESSTEKGQSVDLVAVIQKVEKKELEIAVNSYTAMLPSKAGTSYPIGINDWCIIVPFRNNMPEQMYLRRILRKYSWFLMCFTVLYITVGLWLCTPSPERDWSLSFLQAISSLILIAPLRVLSRPNNARMRYLFVILFIMGFFITNMYVTKMASFFTASTTERQIDTEDDVVRAELPIMMLDYEFKVLADLNYTKSFLDLIIVATKSSMDDHRDRFNTSFGYSCQTDRWQFLNKQQLFLRKPLFRVTSICIGPFYHIYAMQKDSHLYKPLQAFILNAYQYGLMQYWEIEAFADALFLGYVSMMSVNEEPLPLTIKFFRSIWYVWWFGLILAALAFICEIKGITCYKTKTMIRKYVQWFNQKISNL